MKKTVKLPKSWTTVTPLSRWIALILFIAIPIAAFYFGIYYQKTTRRGYPNFLCKHWDTVCVPNYADEHSYCAVKQVCTDSTPPANSHDLVVELAIKTLATKLSVNSETIRVVSKTETTWNDSSLGCPKPGVMYTQSLVEGYKIVLASGQKEYEYHGKKNGEPFLCENPTNL